MNIKQIETYIQNGSLPDGWRVAPASGASTAICIPAGAERTANAYHTVHLTRYLYGGAAYRIGVCEAERLLVVGTEQ